MKGGKGKGVCVKKMTKMGRGKYGVKIEIYRMTSVFDLVPRSQCSKGGWGEGARREGRAE